MWTLPLDGELWTDLGEGRALVLLSSGRRNTPHDNLPPSRVFLSSGWASQRPSFALSLSEQV